MKYLSALFIFLIGTALAGNPGNAQPKREFRQYLQTNATDIRDPAVNWEQVFDSSFYKNEIFWIGETHAIVNSYDAKWILFKQIHKRTGFKYYLLESSRITEIYLNNYLLTGDEKFLQRDFAARNGTMGCNMDEYEFCRKLFRYNQELPVAKRVEFVSIDIEHQYVETDQYIRSLFREPDVPGDTGDILHQSLHTKGDYRNSYRKIWMDLNADSSRYRNLLKENFETFRYLVRNINYVFLARASSNWGQTRDSMMFENYKARQVTHDFQKLKVFAYFGTIHCYLERTRHAEGIAYLIKNSTPPLKSVSVMMIYSNCMAMRPMWMMPKSRRSSQSNEMDYTTAPVNDDRWHVVGKLSQNGYNLVDITRKDSPFQRSGKFVYDLDKGKFTTDYFQYMLIIKNSPASLPFRIK